MMIPYCKVYRQLQKESGNFILRGENAMLNREWEDFFNIEEVYDTSDVGID